MKMALPQIELKGMPMNDESSSHEGKMMIYLNPNTIILQKCRVLILSDYSTFARGFWN
jgi:hypothetical protein